MRHVGGTVGVKPLRVVGLSVVLAMTAACNPFSSSSAKNTPGPTVTPTTTTTTHHHIVVITKRTHTVKAGTTVQIGTPQQGAAGLFHVGKPSVSRTRLSKTYGYGPAHGYYVTFRIRIFNDGKSPLIIDRLDFWVSNANGKTNTNGGNAPYSGARTQLDTTELTTGQSVDNYLTFDVSSPHGTFVFGPGNKTSVAWTF